MRACAATVDGSVRPDDLRSWVTALHGLTGCPVVINTAQPAWPEDAGWLEDFVLD